MAAYRSDGASIVIGSLMGTSPVTVFVGEQHCSALELLHMCNTRTCCFLLLASKAERRRSSSFLHTCAVRRTANSGLEAVSTLTVLRWCLCGMEKEVLDFVLKHSYATMQSQPQASGREAGRASWHRLWPSGCSSPSGLLPSLVSMPLASLLSILRKLILPLISYPTEWAGRLAHL